MKILTIDLSKPEPSKHEEFVSAVSGAVSELLFVLLPMLVISLVFIYKGEGSHIAGSAEWSFGASILFGQALVRLMRSFAETGGVFGERAALVASSIIVVGLLPSLIALTLLLVQEPAPPQFWLVVVQFLLFAAAVAVHFVSFLLVQLAPSPNTPPAALHE